MRAVVRFEEGALGLNSMWLPTWIGMNTALVKELEDHLAKSFLGHPLSRDTLDRANRSVIDLLVQKFPQLHGLGDYLDGLKFVEEPTSCSPKMTAYT